MLFKGVLLMYCYDSIEELRTKTDLKKFIDENGMKCKKCGGELAGAFENEFYMCPKCATKGSCGNIFTAVMEVKNIDFTKSLEYIAEKENFQIKDCIMDCDISNHEYKKHCLKCELHERNKRK